VLRGLQRASGPNLITDRALEGLLLSQRRGAQLGVLAATLLLMSTLTILFIGSRDTVPQPQQAKNGQPVVIGDTAPKLPVTSTKLALVGGRR
jgi:hypothetical protein